MPRTLILLRQMTERKASLTGCCGNDGGPVRRLEGTHMAGARFMVPPRGLGSDSTAATKSAQKCGSVRLRTHATKPA
jgi:hypothetical protein